MANLEEKFLKREEIFDGAVLHVVKDTVILPNGKEATREMCLHVGAVCVIPMLSDGRVIMERQYRYPHGRVFFEIPAGKLNFTEIADFLGFSSLHYFSRRFKNALGISPSEFERGCKDKRAQGRNDASSS